MNFFVRLLGVVLAWVITGLISYMGYNHEIDMGPAIVISSIMLFLSLLSTLVCFVPNTIYRFVFGGSDNKFW